MMGWGEMAYARVGGRWGRWSGVEGDGVGWGELGW